MITESCIPLKLCVGNTVSGNGNMIVIGCFYGSILLLIKNGRFLCFHWLDGFIKKLPPCLCRCLSEHHQKPKAWSTQVPDVQEVHRGTPALQIVHFKT